MEQEYSNQEKEFIKNIYSEDLLDLLKKNKFTFNFIINYILNEKYQITRKEKNITIDTVLNYQPHLKEDFIKLISK